MRRPRRRRAAATAINARAFLALVCAVVLCGGGGASARAAGTPSAISSDPRTVSLVDQDGRPFRVLSLAGEPTLITFVASRCTDACPIADAVFFRLAAALRRDGVRARLMTVTLDPKYDTPFVMSSLARRYRADSRRWTFASGAVPEVARLMSSLGVEARPDARGIPEEHSSFVYLLDRHARLARTFLLSAEFAKTGEAAVRALQ